MKSVHSLEKLLNTAPDKDAFLAALASFETPDVVIDDDALDRYVQTLRPPRGLAPWSEYIGKNETLEQDFIELAVSTVQQGGYLYEDPATGRALKWEINGSGSKALLSKMDQARNAGILPALHIQDPKEARSVLKDFFKDAPFAKERLDLWCEIAAPESVARLKAVFNSAAKNDGSFSFDFRHTLALRDALPRGLKDPFLKKAGLIPLLFAGVAASKGVKVDVDGVLPADYRLPQTGHNVGILRFSQRLVDILEANIVVTDKHPVVAQIRAQIILAGEKILQKQKTKDVGIALPHLDGDFWFAGRLFDSDPATMNNSKRAVREALEACRVESSFKKDGFMQTSAKPINVETLRF